jgi:hypothetical protein
MAVRSRQGSRAPVSCARSQTSNGRLKSKSSCPQRRSRRRRRPPPLPPRKSNNPRLLRLRLSLSSLRQRRLQQRRPRRPLPRQSRKSQRPLQQPRLPWKRPSLGLRRHRLLWRSLRRHHPRPRLSGRRRRGPRRPSKRPSRPPGRSLSRRHRPPLSSRT